MSVCMYVCMLGMYVRYVCMYGGGKWAGIPYRVRYFMEVHTHTPR